MRASIDLSKAADQVAAGHAKPEADTLGTARRAAAREISKATPWAADAIETALRRADVIGMSLRETVSLMEAAFAHGVSPAYLFDWLGRVSTLRDRWFRGDTLDLAPRGIWFIAWLRSKRLLGDTGDWTPLKIRHDGTTVWTFEETPLPEELEVVAWRRGPEPPLP